jgi:hypothetical protein
MKTKNKNNWMMLVVTVIMIIFTACSNGKKPTEDRNQVGESGIITQEEQDRGLTQSDIMRKYFPLNVGNTWTYKRTLKDPDNVYTYTDKLVTEAGWDIPKGTMYFTIGKSLIGEKVGTSEETYTITGKDESNFFNISLKADKKARDGRYVDEYSSKPTDPNIKWKYLGEGVWETVDGSYADTKTENQVFTAVLKPDISLCDPAKENEDPSWIVGATMYTGGTITVPAGTFSDILENVTMVGGSNIEDVLTKNATMQTRKKDTFGCYMTKSYYAKNVGLILEIQTNLQGKETYRMELESYKVN